MSAAGSAPASRTQAAGTTASPPASPPASRARASSRADARRARIFDFTARARRRRLVGRRLRAGQRRPHRSCPSSRSWRSRPRPLPKPGHATAGARRARSADAARAVAAAARRGARRAARLQPAGVRTSAGAGSAAGCCTSCCATCRRCRRPIAPPPRAASSPSRRMASTRRRSRPGRPRRWPSPKRPAHAGAVRRGLARRGAADRHGEDAARDLHRERPGRPAGGHGKRSADRRLQDQPAAAATRRRAWRWPIAASSRSTARCSREIYPAHTVRAFLLWTATPRLMEIDAETLDDSMPYAGAS